MFSYQLWSCLQGYIGAIVFLLSIRFSFRVYGRDRKCHKDERHLREAFRKARSDYSRLVILSPPSTYIPLTSDEYGLPAETGPKCLHHNVVPVGLMDWDRDSKYEQVAVLCTDCYEQLAPEFKPPTRIVSAPDT